MSPAILHFLKRLCGPLAGFFNLSRWQIFGFGRRLPGDRFSVGDPGRYVQFNILLDMIARSPMYLLGRIFFLWFADDCIGPSAVGREAGAFDDGHDGTAFRRAGLTSTPLNWMPWVCAAAADANTRA